VRAPRNDPEPARISIRVSPRAAVRTRLASAGFVDPGVVVITACELVVGAVVVVVVWSCCCHDWQHQDQDTGILPGYRRVLNPNAASPDAAPVDHPAHQGKINPNWVNPG
jgi:hypothetical protein